MLELKINAISSIVIWPSVQIGHTDEIRNRQKQILYYKYYKTLTYRLLCIIKWCFYLQIISYVFFMFIKQCIRMMDLGFFLSRYCFIIDGKMKNDWFHDHHVPSLTTTFTCPFHLRQPLIRPMLLKYIGLLHTILQANCIVCTYSLLL